MRPIYNEKQSSSFYCRILLYKLTRIMMLILKICLHLYNIHVVHLYNSNEDKISHKNHQYKKTKLLPTTKTRHWCFILVRTGYKIILTIILLETNGISLCHLYITRPACTFVQSDQTLHCWLTNTSSDLGISKTDNGQFQKLKVDYFIKKSIW